MQYKEANVRDAMIHNNKKNHKSSGKLITEQNLLLSFHALLSEHPSYKNVLLEATLERNGTRGGLPRAGIVPNKISGSFQNRINIALNHKRPFLV